MRVFAQAAARTARAWPAAAAAPARAWAGRHAGMTLRALPTQYARTATLATGAWGGVHAHTLAGSLHARPSRAFSTSTVHCSVPEGGANDAALGGVEPTGVVLDPAAITADLVTEAPITAATAASSSTTPVSLVTDALVAMHETGVVPWYVALIGVTLTVRTALLPLNIMMMRNSAKLTQIKPEAEKLGRELKAAQARAQASVNSDEVKAVRDKLKGLWAKNNVHPLKSFLSPLVQMPVFVSFFLSLRRLAESEPSFTTGGTAWFTNLSVPDPTLLLPLFSSATMAVTFELSPEIQSRPMMKWGMRGLSVGVLFLTYKLPAGIFVYWCTNNMYSLVYGQAMRNDKVKRMFDIPVLAQQPGQSQSPAEMLQKALGGEKKKPTTAARRRKRRKLRR